MHLTFFLYYHILHINIYHFTFFWYILGSYPYQPSFLELSPKMSRVTCSSCTFTLIPSYLTLTCSVQQHLLLGFYFFFPISICYIWPWTLLIFQLLKFSISSDGFILFDDSLLIVFAKYFSLAFAMVKSLKFPNTLMIK